MISILPFQSVDIPACYSLFKDTHSNPWSYQSFRQSFARGHCLIAKQAEKIIGFALYQILFDQGDLLFIGIDKGYRKKGISGALLSAVIDDCKLRQAQTLMLEVSNKNLYAIKLYERLEFTLIDTRKNYYVEKNGDSSDALIYQFSFI